MHYLCFSLGQEKFALPSIDIVRVLPLLNLTSIPQSPAYIPGYFHYQDKYLVVLDLSLLCLQKPSLKVVSSRIVIVSFMNSENKNYQLALLLENAVETLKIEDKQWRANPLSPKEGNIGGQIAHYNNKAIQQVVLKELLLPDVLELIHATE